MQIPDRVIVRRLKGYDPYLFVEWNNRFGYFEIWRMMPHGRRLITPVTQSIYDPALPKAFVQLDERILWWLVAADSWRNGGPKKHALQDDERWKEFQKRKDQKMRETFYDYGKDAYRAVTNFYATKLPSKNRKTPHFNKAKKVSQWVRPDVRTVNSPRLFARSAGNARALGFKGR